MANIRPNQLPPATTITDNDRLILDQGAAGVNAAAPSSLLNTFAPVATQAEAEAGTDNVKRMTPLRAQQHLLAQGVPNTRVIMAGDGLTGGGTLDANRTLALSSTSIASLALADSAVQSVNGKTGSSITLTKADVGLSNVDNTSDANKPISTATQTALNAKADSSITITAGAGLTGGGNLTTNRSIALNAASIASLGKADTALQAPGGTAGQILAKSSDTDNDVGWVSSEAATAVSYGPQTLTEAQQEQARANIGAFANPSGTTSQYIRGNGTVATLNKAAVGLSNVDNTSDANKPISTATQTALNTKYNNTGGQLTGNIIIRKDIGRFEFISPSSANGYVLRANISDTVDGGLGVLRFGTAIVEFTGSPSLKVTGNATVSGTLSKAGGTFDIDHPTDPFNKNLRHGFVESTEYLNLYRGSVDLENGRMTVDIDAAFGMTDGTFADLNEPNEVVVFLQTQFGPERVWIEAPVDNGKFTIISERENSTATIGWMVTARRNDPFVRNIDENCERGTGRFIPEYEKEEV